MTMELGIPARIELSTMLITNMLNFPSFTGYKFESERSLKMTAQQSDSNHPSSFDPKTPSPCVQKHLV
jgi:hypothetical protein